jgi:hypothetical protein
MITDAIIKKEFVRQILKRDSDYIRQFQAKVVEEAGLMKSGELLLDLRGQSGAKILQGEGMHLLSVSFLKYLRFQDINSNSKSGKKRAKIDVGNNYERRNKEMPLRRHLALYNKVIFGRLYNETKTDLKYGYTEEIKKQITEQLEKSGYEKK